MKIKIVGAAGGEVTGSAYYLQTKKAKVLIDAGMFQGGKRSEAKNRLPQGVKVAQLDSVLLTHAHLDHTGRVPLLIKHGFRGPIFATAATIDLAEIILKDSARLQEYDAKRINRKLEGTSKAPVEPLYSPEDVAPFRQMGHEVMFREELNVAPGITARWIEAGHMLGSGSIELKVHEDGTTTTILFSGDLGPGTLPIIRPFEPPRQADVVFLESTYGDRDHKPYAETIAEFEELIKAIVTQKGKILVPTFAIGRSQQILYHLALMFDEKAVPPFHVYVDSPMALEAGKAMVNHPDLFHPEMVEFQRRGLLPLDKKWFHSVPTPKESQALNDIDGPCLIMAGAGMCNGGRILHHFRANLFKDSTHVMIVGYQGHGSLGRRLVEGAKSVSIFGEKIAVRAKIHTLNGFSAHAGQGDLLRWFGAVAGARPRVILTHGEDNPRKALASQIQQRFGLVPELPRQGDVIEIVRAEHAFARSA